MAESATEGLRYEPVQPGSGRRGGGLRKRAAEPVLESFEDASDAASIRPEPGPRTRTLRSYQRRYLRRAEDPVSVVVLRRSPDSRPPRMTAV